MECPSDTTLSKLASNVNSGEGLIVTAEHIVPQVTRGQVRNSKESLYVCFKGRISKDAEKLIMEELELFLSRFSPEDIDWKNVRTTVVSTPLLDQLYNKVTHHVRRGLIIDPDLEVPSSDSSSKWSIKQKISFSLVVLAGLGIGACTKACISGLDRSASSSKPASNAPQVPPPPPSSNPPSSNEEAPKRVMVPKSPLAPSVSESTRSKSQGKPKFADPVSHPENPYLVKFNNFRKNNFKTKKGDMLADGQVLWELLNARQFDGGEFGAEYLSKSPMKEFLDCDREGQQKWYDVRALVEMSPDVGKQKAKIGLLIEAVKLPSRKPLLDKDFLKALDESIRKVKGSKFDSDTLNSFLKRRSADFERIPVNYSVDGPVVEWATPADAERIAILLEVIKEISLEVSERSARIENWEDLFSERGESLNKEVTTGKTETSRQVATKVWEVVLPIWRWHDELKR